MSTRQTIIAAASAGVLSTALVLLAVLFAPGYATPLAVGGLLAGGIAAGLTGKRALASLLATDTVRDEAVRIRSMMEQSPIPVMFAGTDLVISYVNPKAVETMRELEQHLPIRADELLGANIDIFHTNPAHQRRMLADPRNLPHRAQIKVGPELLDLLVSPITDDRGSYTGAMVTWELTTEKVRLEAEMARVQNMMENAPTNVMFADRDMVIRYMNPASVRTLHSIQEHLPTPVSSMIGQTIDVFHKRPEYQRGILEDPSMLPRRANIQVGPETLDLLVSAIHDAEGNYTGAMVTWEVITKQLEQKERIERAASDALPHSRDADDRGKKLEESSREIGKVVELISSIAEETNLLALNATIEAARAGDAGSGFAVVAGEVKALAVQTSQSAAEIKNRIEVIQEDTGGVVEALSSITQIIESLARSTGASTSAQSNNRTAAGDGTARDGVPRAARAEQLHRTLTTTA